jgi:anti-sigma factor RsiW
MTASGKENPRARLTDLLDGDLPDEERAAVEAMLDDPELRAEMEAARSGQALLRGLTPQPTPANFLRKVQRRVRRKSAGRHFHPAHSPIGFGISIEVFIVVAIAVMAACWMVLDLGRQGLEYDVFRAPDAVHAAPKESVTPPREAPAPAPTPPTTPPGPR